MDYEKRLINEFKEKYHHLVEYTNAGGMYHVNEDGEEDPNAMGGDPNAMGSDPGMMGGDPNAMGGGDPGMMGGDPNAMGGDPGMMGGDPNAMGTNSNGVEGFNPQGVDNNGMENTGEDEEVIDVDELVDKQDETSEKLDKISSTFDRLLDKMNDFKSLVDSSNERIDKLAAEIEKRNPTPVEKLSLRSGNGYPFNQTPDQYWNEKQATSNYSTEDDNNGADDPKYKITKDEIDNFNDYASVYKSLNDDYGLKDMFGY